MSSSARILQVLGLFGAGHEVVTPERAMRALNISRATAYRYLGDLAAAGFVERVPGRGYALGPAIVELDRQVRLADPLLQASRDELHRLAEDTGGTALLCGYYGAKVLCIHEEPGRRGPPAVSYERGRAMPLYAGATSKIILAFLPEREIEQLWARERKAIRAAGLPDSLPALKALLARLRADRLCVAQGELDPGALGMAVPILHGRQVRGSLSVVLSATAVRPAQYKAMTQKLFAALARIENRLEEARARMRRGTPEPQR